MALVIVLAVLVLIAVLILGFFGVAQQERTASGFYESGANARHLVDTATGVVTAQIQQATSEPDLAWISQPGLLRTFDSGGQVAAYKLYSSDAMRAGADFDPAQAAGTEIPADWAARPNEFVDLNQPVVVRTVSSGGSPLTATNFPIVDPSLAGLAGQPNPTGPEGFSLQTASVPASGAAANPLPMPVRWIYLLGDGTLATYAEAAKPGSDVIGRIAFWTDDETCKVNLNTAAGGVFYDAPTANTKEDHDMALYQPIAQEYQRYPGHPATTSLAAVFPSLRTGSPTDRSRAASLLTPRVGWGGSEGGTVEAWWTRNPGQIDADRLFASVAEAGFGRNTSDGSWNAASGIREESPLAGEALQKYGFFATTDSRSPELNLLNRPRITLWPFNRELVNTPLGLTPEDRLIQFASELGTNRRKLYFQRENAWDPFHDFTAIPENQDLYGYLQWLTAQPLPGEAQRSGGGDSLEDKYGALGRDQVLTQVFDYLRGTVNTVNFSYLPVGGPSYSFPQGHTANIAGFNDITPLAIETSSGWTKGLVGPVLNELIFQFYNAGEQVFDDSNQPVAADSPDAEYLVRRVQMVALMDFWTVINNLNTSMPRFQVKMEGAEFVLTPNPVNSEGQPVNSEPIQVRREGAPAWGTGPINLGLPSAGNNVNVVCSKDAQFDTGFATSVLGGPLGIGYGLRAPDMNRANRSFLTRQSVGKTLSRQSGYAFYPFVSDMVEFRIPFVDGPGGTRMLAEPGAVHVQGGAITVTLYPALPESHVGGPTRTFDTLAPTSGNGFFQQISLAAGAFAMPLPRLGPASKFQNDYMWGDKPNYPTYADLADYALRQRYDAYDMIMQTPRAPFLQGGADNDANAHSEPMDVFRSIQLRSDAGCYGDLRVAAATRNIPPNWFQPHPANQDPSLFHGTSVISQRQIGDEAIALGPAVSSSDLATLESLRARLLPGVAFHPGAAQRTAGPAVNGAFRRSATGSVPGSSPGDWSSAYGVRGDGALVPGPDVGAITRSKSTMDPYFSEQISRAGISDDVQANFNQNNFTGLLFSPWKQMPSAISLGTLPARPLAGAPWETLLFNPVPNGGKDTHFGWAELPRDHYWLDLFTMPVVEPYAITENLATAGKINLNQQIAPFTYIRRETGLYALLSDLQIMAVPDADSSTYKTHNLKNRTKANASNAGYRHAVDVPATVAQMAARLEANDPFVSASEICEIPLIPEGQNAGSLDAFWSARQLTGDNKREMPYGHLYPRVTTRSNTFKVYYWVQSLKPRPGSSGQWIVTGQQRGSQTVERFLNLGLEIYGSGSSPQEQFPALAGNHPVSGQPYYRFRTINNQQFAP